jgi:hypothetical protein
VSGGGEFKSKGGCSTSMSEFAVLTSSREGGVVDSEGMGDGGRDGLDPCGSCPSMWCLAHMCWVHPPLLWKCRGQKGHPRVGGGEPRV